MTRPATIQRVHQTRSSSADVRLPPSNAVAEAGALCCALGDPNLLSKLRKDHFYEATHLVVFDTLIEMRSQGKPISVETLHSHLLTTGMLEKAGGGGMLCQIGDASASKELFPSFLEDLNIANARRYMLRWGVKLQQAANDSDQHPRTSLEALITETHGFLHSSTASLESFPEATDTFIRFCEHPELEDNQRLSVGFPSVDDVLGGLRPGQMLIVAARPGEGKSTLLQNMAMANAEAGNPSLIVSMEMTPSEYARRCVCARARLSLQALEKGDLSPKQLERLQEIGKQIRSVPMQVVCPAGNSFEAMEAACRKAAQSDQTKLILVDYIQLLNLGKDNHSTRYEAMTTISNRMKSLAMQLRLPIVVCAQLNREMERDGRAPRASDLRDSGALEQDADIIILLQSQIHEERDGIVPTKLFIAKNRNGPTRQITLDWEKAYFRFSDREHSSFSAKRP